MKQALFNSLYRLFCHACRIKSSYAYFESHASNDFAGNMLRIAETLLSGGYGIKRVYISISSKDNLPLNIKILQKKFPNKVRLVLRGRVSNYYAYATSKYLFTDVNFMIPFIKRKGQIITQTWHGTPLKKLGFDYVKDVSLTTNQKRAFVIADYCLFPNVYTMKEMIKSYRLDNIMQGKILLEGYPRNCVFFESDKTEKLRAHLGLLNKQVGVYMPTWRGSLHNKMNLSQSKQVQSYLLELDELLTEKQVLFVKLHRLNQTSIDFTKFRRILPFPSEYETYEFLSIADYLVTDYSSVMFDFLSTRKKIILFVYDKYEYLKQQGTYFDLDELPFPQVDNIKDLAYELRLPKQYDDTDVWKKFCPYDDKYAVDRLCQKVIKGENTCVVIEPPSNQKENVLLYCGALHENNTTINFIHYLDTLNTNEKNYTVTFLNHAFRTNPLRLQCIDRSINLISIDFFNGKSICPTVSELIALRWFKRYGWMRKFLRKKIKSLYQREFNRQFFDIEWSEVLRFGGLDIDTLCLFTYATIKKKTFITYPSYTDQTKEFWLFMNEAKKNDVRFIHVKDNNTIYNIELMKDIKLVESI